MLGTTTLDFNMNDDNNNIMVTKQYQFNAEIVFDCQYPDIASAVGADMPNNFDNYKLLNIKLVKSLIKKKEKEDGESLSDAAKSK